MLICQEENPVLYNCYISDPQAYGRIVSPEHLTIGEVDAFQNPLLKPNQPILN
ncbi:MAG: hypothetical protein NZ653_05980 [Anaerolineae bacterium]|nr:hypothetical protein [Anaerolineae bacterium]